ncbi:sulfotransferase [Epibacterium mobile]|nr:sulfotransferase [Tritonibacter mobilis]
MFAALEPWYFRRNFKNPSSRVPVFIVGAPRTGSTVLYQMLSNNNDFLYIDNLASAFNRSLPFGIWLSQLAFKGKAHNSFQSKYGNTPFLHSPSESQSFWYRWFPKDRDFVELGDISPERIQDMQKTIVSIMEHHKKDILFKNLACGQRIRVIHHAFPNAKFIFIKRDPVFTAQSLLLARRHLGIDDSTWWSVKPREFASINELPIHEKLIQQISLVEHQIATDLKNIPDKNKIEINYQDLPDGVTRIQEFLGLSTNPNSESNMRQFENKVNMEEAEFNLLLASYDSIDRVEEC